MSDIKIKVLPNGLTIIGESCPWHRSVATGIFVKTGARDETVKESGISHFLEHMVFKGTPKRSSLQMTYEMGNIGAQANAYTSEENTVFYGAVLPEYFPNMVDIVSDMMRPTLDSQEFDMEKKVILEEIALYEDKPNFCLYVQSFGDYFAGHPGGNSVLGTQASVGAITRDEMAAYHKRRYAPSNMALIAAGDFSFDKLCELGEQYLGDIPTFNAPREKKPHTNPGNSKEFRKKNFNQAYVMLLSDGPGANDPKRIPLEVLSAIIGDGTGSKLYWELVYRGIAESAVLEVEERDDSGCVIAFASCELERMQEVQDKLRKIVSDPLNFTDEDLVRVKKKLLSRIVLSGETPSARLFSLGHGWTSRNKPEPLAEIIKQLNGVTRKDIEAAVACWPLQQWSTYTMLPE